MVPFSHERSILDAFILSMTHCLKDSSWIWWANLLFLKCTSRTQCTQRKFVMALFSTVYWLHLQTCVLRKYAFKRVNSQICRENHGTFIPQKKCPNNSTSRWFLQVGYVRNLSSLESWFLYHWCMFCLPVGCVLVKKTSCHRNNLRRIAGMVFFFSGGIEISQVYPMYILSPWPVMKLGMLGFP